MVIYCDRNAVPVTLVVIMGLCLLIIFIYSLVQTASHFSIDKQVSVKTCNYANNLTDIINLQSEILKVYTGANYTKLNKLNCSLLMVV